MKITRQHMIDAVMTEPLMRGAWMTSDSMLTISYREENDIFGLGAIALTYGPRACPVCAVGGMLRKAGVEPGQIAYVADTLTYECLIASMDDVEDHLLIGNYAAALSCFFEDGDWKTREDLKAWILENVPADWEIEV